MSTILQALQKSKLTQAGGPPSVVQPSMETTPWKIALSLALLTIIVLLSTLIYLLLNPANMSTSSPKAAMELTQDNRSAVKISFVTQPLPLSEPNRKKVAPIKENINTALVTKVTILPEKSLIVTTPPAVKEPSVEQQTVDYEDVPSDLKKRFKLAVLLADMEQHDVTTDNNTYEEVDSDGSDIREMSGDFQDKVPLIRYDSHMYSSLVEERWIRINGEVLVEGETDSSGQLELIEIQPQRSIFRLDRQSFSIEALQDWKGY